MAKEAVIVLQCTKNVPTCFYLLLKAILSLKNRIRGHKWLYISQNLMGLKKDGMNNSALNNRVIGGSRNRGYGSTDRDSIIYQLLLLLVVIICLLPQLYPN